MSIEFINPSTLWRPAAFSQVAIVSSARQIHISGQVALNAAGALVGEGDLIAQTEQVYDNLKAALAFADADFSHVFKVVTYVVDLTADKAAQVRDVRMRYLRQGQYPASTMVGVSALVAPGFLIEIEAIAALEL